MLGRDVEQVADPLLANLRGAALIAALTLGAVDPRRCGTWYRWPRPISPDPAERAVYDQLAAEFPALYKAQRGTFARLDR